MHCLWLRVKAARGVSLQMSWHALCTTGVAIRICLSPLQSAWGICMHGICIHQVGLHVHACMAVVGSPLDSSCSGAWPWLRTS